MAQERYQGYQEDSTTTLRGLDGYQFFLCNCESCVRFCITGNGTSRQTSALGGAVGWQSSADVWLLVACGSVVPGVGTAVGIVAGGLLGEGG